MGSLASAVPSSSPSNLAKEYVTKAAKNSLQSSNLDHIVTCMHAISNAEEAFPIEEIRSFQFHSHPSVHIRRKAFSIFPIVFSSIAASEGPVDPQYPFTISKSTNHTLGGSTISVMYNASVILQTNFNCNTSSFHYRMEAKTESYLTFFGSTTRAISASAGYGENVENGAYFRVWDKVVKKYNFKTFNCIETKSEEYKYSFPGFSKTFSIWLGIVPVTFTLNTGMNTSFDWSSKFCPNELKANFGVDPKASIHLSGSTSVNLLVAKAGIDLKGSFDAEIKPSTFVTGSECEMGYNAQMIIKPVEVSFSTFLVRRKCDFLWIFKCTNDYYDEQRWMNWSIPPSSVYLLDYKGKIKK